MNKNLSSLGAYELIKPKRKPIVTIIASGSEVHLAIEVMDILKNNDSNYINYFTKLNVIKQKTNITP